MRHHSPTFANAKLQNETSSSETNSLLYSQLRRLKKDYFLEFVEILCHQAVKEIDTSEKVQKRFYRLTATINQ